MTMVPLTITGLDALLLLLASGTTVTVLPLALPLDELCDDDKGATSDDEEDTEGAIDTLLLLESGMTVTVLPLALPL